MINDIPANLREALFIDNPHAGAVISAGYKVTEINKRWVDLFGYSPSEMESLTLVEIAEMQRDKQEIDRKVLMMINAYVPYDRIDMIARTKLNDLRKVRIALIGVFDEAKGGRFEYAIVWARDLGPYEPSEIVVGRLRRLWPYIVIMTTVLWLADFSELLHIALDQLPGGGA